LKKIHGLDIQPLSAEGNGEVNLFAKSIFFSLGLSGSTHIIGLALALGLVIVGLAEGSTRAARSRLA
jgi:hypothetical protein